MSYNYTAWYFARLNAFDFRDLQDKVSRPITVLQNVTFHRTLVDRFLDAFREQVAENPFYETSQVSFKSVFYFLKGGKESHYILYVKEFCLILYLLSSEIGLFIKFNLGKTYAACFCFNFSA